MSVVIAVRLLTVAWLLTGQGHGLGAQTKEFVGAVPTTPAAHASTLVQLKNGSWLVAWFGGSAEGDPDVAIWAASRLLDGRWTKPVVMAREPGVPTWNPVLFFNGSGRLWLYYKFGPSYTWWTAARLYSEDDGRTWSPIEHLPAGIYGPIRAKPLLLGDGTIVSGTSVESYSSWAAWVGISQDGGNTWIRHGPLEITRAAAGLNGQTIASDREKPSTGLERPFGIIQPTIISLSPTHLRLYARSSPQIGRICAADSFDGGATWGMVRAMSLPNPNSGIDTVTLKDGRVVLIYNDTDKGRTPLNLAVSKDGEHFENFLTLESAPGEFSYPAIVQGRDRDLYMTYTWNRKRIRFVHVPLANVPLGDDDSAKDK